MDCARRYGCAKIGRDVTVLRESSTAQLNGKSNRSPAWRHTKLVTDAIELIHARPKVSHSAHTEQSSGLSHASVISTKWHQWRGSYQTSSRTTRTVTPRQSLAGDERHAREAVEEVHFGPDLAHVALELGAPVARSTSTAKRGHRDPLARCPRARWWTVVTRGCVHVRNRCTHCVDGSTCLVW